MMINKKDLTDDDNTRGVQCLKEIENYYILDSLSLPLSLFYPFFKIIMIISHLFPSLYALVELFLSDKVSKFVVVDDVVVDIRSICPPIGCTQSCVNQLVFSRHLIILLQKLLSVQSSVQAGSG